MPLFKSLASHELHALLSNASEQVFPPGYMVIRQGEPGRAAYVVLTGRVRVVESVPDNPVEVFLGELGAGEIFGELGILRERPRSASVLTLEKTRCLKLSEEDFLFTLKRSREMSLELLKVLAGRLCEADQSLARHAPDPLTGLPGRRAFHELYRRLTASARRRQTSVSLLALDVLHLKEINAKYGYSIGNRVLRAVADALLASSRATDLVARYGSDEFAALLVDAGDRDAAVVLSRVQRNLREMAVNRGLPVAVECSIGYAVSHNPPENADELLRAADQDMQSKKYGQIRW